MIPIACGGGPGEGGGHGGGHGGHGGARKGKGGPLTVGTVALERMRIERHYRTSGTLQAIRATEINAVQPAIIRDIRIDEGDLVQKNDVLARLDGRELSLQADVARVQLDNLERELKRLERASNVISAEEIALQQNAVAEARAAAKLSKFQAKQTTVRAPFDGTIVERHVDEGALATTATALFSLADLSTLELALHLPERDAATVETGSDVELELVDGTVFTAKIFRRAPIVDATTGTVKFTVRTSEAPRHAVPGAFVRARVLVDARDDAPALVRTALFELDGKQHIFVIEEGKARRREVKVGLSGATHVEILEGVQPGDVVVAEGSAGVTEGMPLQSASGAGEGDADENGPEEGDVAQAKGADAKPVRSGA